MPEFNINDPAITDEHRAVINEYSLEVTKTKDGRFMVTDPVYRAAKGGKGGKYASKELTPALNDAVGSRKQLTEAELETKTVADNDIEKAAEPAAPDTTNDETQENTSKRGKARQNKRDATATHTTPPVEDAAAPTEKKGRTRKTKEPKQRKDNRYLRCARVVAADLSLAPTGARSGKAWDTNQHKLAAAVGDVSVASAGHFFEAWVNITAVLTERGWLKLPEA